jgi:acyl dehydratase
MTGYASERRVGQHMLRCKIEKTNSPKVLERRGNMGRVSVGEVFERTMTFDEAGARAFATLVGDFNPIHHDADFAAGSRFGGLIISGTQSVALLMAMTATFLSARGAALGLDYSFRFRKGVRMNETCHLKWVVTEVLEKSGLGEIVSFDASMTILSSGEVAVSGSGKCALLDAA